MFATAVVKARSGGVSPIVREESLSQAFLGPSLTVGLLPHSTFAPAEPNPFLARDAITFGHSAAKTSD